MFCCRCCSTKAEISKINLWLVSVVRMRITESNACNWHTQLQANRDGDIHTHTHTHTNIWNKNINLRLLMASSLTQSAVKLSFATHPISVRFEDVIPMTTTRRLELTLSNFCLHNFYNSRQLRESQSVVILALICYFYLTNLISQNPLFTCLRWPRHSLSISSVSISKNFSSIAN